MGVNTRINRERCPKNYLFWENWSKRQKPGSSVNYWNFWFMEWRRATLKQKCITSGPDLGWYFEEEEFYQPHYLIRPSWIPMWILERSEGYL